MRELSVFDQLVLDFISPLEIQIAYKMFLGSLKDLEDAKFLFELFKYEIDKKLLISFLLLLNVDRKVAKKWLGIKLK